MKNPNRFYTYAYLRKDRTPYYIGKGEGNRAYYKSKGEVKPPKDKSRIIFLKQNLLEEKAFKHEIYMIAVFGRKDLGTGILRNRTNGGDGASGFIHSQETRKKMSEAQKGENHPHYGKSRPKEVKRKISEKHKGKILSVEHRKKLSEKKEGKNHPNYGKSLSKETKRKVGQANKNRKWWNDGCGNTKFCVECPEESWVLGRGKEFKLKTGENKKNLKWWNDGCGNSKRSIECPGKNWVAGRPKKNNKDT